MSTDSIKSELSDRLSDLLDEMNMSPSRLASEINKGKSTITKIKNGDSQSSKQTLELIADFFGVNYRWLVTGIGAKYKGVTASYGEANPVRDNVSSSDLFQRLEVVNFKKNVFIKTSFNKYLMLVPVLDEMAQESLIRDPYCDVSRYNQYPVPVDQPTGGTYVGFSMNPDAMTTKLLGWNVIAKRIQVIVKEVNRELWLENFTFQAHRFYVILTKNGLYIREIISQPNEEGVVQLRHLNKKGEYVQDELCLKKCYRIFSVMNISHEFVG